MGADSKIEWTDHTFNPWIGCTKVSPGCANCYAETEDKRRGWTPDGWGKGKERRHTSENYWKQPLKWNRDARVAREECREDEFAAEECGATDEELRAMQYRRPRVFCASLADVFDPEVPDEWRFALFDTITETPNLDWLILTKRPEIAHDFYHNKISLRDDTIINKFLPNVWLGVSVEDQKRANERIPILLEIPAKIRFLSCEPLLGPVNLCRGCPGCPNDCGWTPNENGYGIHWVIVGGESGPNARPCDINWIQSITDQCKMASVPVFVKQLGSKPFTGIKGFGPIVRDRKGGEPSEWPENLRVREFPGRVEA
jgi:protein gp37